MTTNLRSRNAAIAFALCVAVAAPAPLALTSCASKEGGAGLGAGLGALAGAAAGYAISGDAEGALIGAAAGAAVGAAAGWALSDKKEKQVAAEPQVRQQLPPEQKAAGRPVVEVRDLAVMPTEATAGEPVTVAVMMRSVGDGTSTIKPPSAQVDIMRDGNVLRSDVVEATQVGDSELSFTLPIPEAAEEGTYIVAVTALPHPTTLNPLPEEGSTRSAELFVKAAPVAKKVGAAPRHQVAMYTPADGSSK